MRISPTQTTVVNAYHKALKAKYIAPKVAPVRHARSAEKVQGDHRGKTIDVYA